MTKSIILFLLTSLFYYSGFAQESNLKNLRQLTFGGDNAEAYFSPDGKNLTLQITNPQFGIECDQIYLLDLQKENHSPEDLKLISTGYGRTTCSFFMPDGKHILYASTHEGGHACPAPPKSTDGKYLWAIYPEFDIYVADLNGNVVKQLTNSPGYDAEAVVSPDGKKIIMSFAQEGNSDIYTMDIKTRVVEKLTDHPSIDTSPSYSPDGSYITFNSDRSGFQQIYTMKSDGTNVKRISFGEGLYGTPVWSPRGDLIAFTKLYRNKFYIGVMRSDGSGERLLTENYYQEAPSWAPNGRVLVFYRETASDSSGRGGGAKLWSIDLTGYNERLIQTPTDASDPSWSGLLSGK